VLISPEKALCGYKQMCSVDRPRVRSLPLCIDQGVELIFMSKLIPTTKLGRKMSFAGLFPNLTASNVGIAFLSAQITDLEERCAAMRRRINRKRRESTPATRAQTA
jgi:hypothetical protein